jgi:hypothetical protein
MGLDCSHDAWHGAYSAFMRWRNKLAEVAGLPPLQLMEGFFVKGEYTDPFRTLAREYPESAENFYACLPIKWDALKPDPLYYLLYHSDCDGHIPPGRCKRIAGRLEQLLPLLPDEDDGGHIGSWKEKTQTFIDGLRAAAAANEPLEFM